MVKENDSNEKAADRGMKLALVFISSFLALLYLRSPPSPDKNYLNKIITEGNHICEATEIGNVIGNGIERINQDLDIDLDNINDMYMLLKNGQFYYTSSRNILSGKDDAIYRTWLRGDKIQLDYAKKGKYNADALDSLKYLK
jgi:hypothetical protein